MVLGKETGQIPGFLPQGIVIAFLFYRDYNLMMEICERYY